MDHHIWKQDGPCLVISARSSMCWDQSSTRNIDRSELETSTRAELHCLISGGDVSGSPTSASPHRVFLFSGASPVRFFSHGGGRGGDGGGRCSPSLHSCKLSLSLHYCGSASALETLSRRPRRLQDASDWPLRSPLDDLDSIMHTSLASPLCSYTLFMTL